MEIEVQIDNFIDRAVRLLARLLYASAILLAGCNGSSGGAPLIHKAKPGPATNSSIVAIDCQRERAYVPLLDLNGNLHGQVGVLDLSVDPDAGDPLLKIIDVGEVALPRAAAVDLASGTVLVLLDDVLGTGDLMLINEADDSFVLVKLPDGSRPAENSGIVIDPVTNTALVSMTDSVDSCTAGVGGCTGEAVFDLSTRTFGPLILTLVEVDNFGLDSSTNLSLGSSDPISPTLFATNFSAKLACILEDANLDALNADPDGIAVDPTTDIWVAGNFESSVATIVNLSNATFSGSTSLGCSLDEGGTPPNSVNHDTGAAGRGMGGVAVNPVTHQALMTGSTSNEVALLSLPSKSVKQLAAKKIKSVNGALPKDPNGADFVAAAFPYGTVVDSCNNLGYVIDSSRMFMAQIDLKTLKKDPAAIGTALPAGTCASVTSSFKCDNGNGVRFFPLPGSAGAARDLPGQLGYSAHRK